MRSLVLAAVAATSLAAPLTAQHVPTDSAVLAILRERVDAGRFAGVAVGLVTRDGKRQVIAYGPNAGVQPFDGKSVFEIGSITKTFTAAILADMVKQGEVSLDEPVAKYLPPGTVIPARDGKQITLLDLATQSSGLPRMPSNFAPKDPQNPYADYTPEQMYQFLGGYMLPRGVGEKYEYSNLGVGLLGQALARRAGTDYETLVTRRVLKPLGMKDTRIALGASMQKRLAPGHSDNGAVAKNWDLPTFAGAGALRSTVHDMLTYIHANADSTSRPLGATMAMTHFQRRPGLSPQVTLGLIWNRLKGPNGSTIVWHNGGTGGYRSFTGYSEATGLGVVVLSNTNQSVDDIGLHLLDATFPLAPLPKVRKAVTLTADVLDRYLGVFAMTPTFSLTITRDGTQLFAQATDQPRFRLFAEKEDEFFLKVVDAQVSFTKDSTGAVTGLVLHQAGQNIPGKKK